MPIPKKTIASIIFSLALLYPLYLTYHHLYPKITKKTYPQSTSPKTPTPIASSSTAQPHNTPPPAQQTPPTPLTPSPTSAPTSAPPHCSQPYSHELFVCSLPPPTSPNPLTTQTSLLYACSSGSNIQIQQYTTSPVSPTSELYASWSDILKPPLGSWNETQKDSQFYLFTTLSSPSAPTPSSPLYAAKNLSLTINLPAPLSDNSLSSSSSSTTAIASTTLTRGTHYPCTLLRGNFNSMFIYSAPPSLHAPQPPSPSVNSAPILPSAPASTTDTTQQPNN